MFAILRAALSADWEIFQSIINQWCYDHFGHYPFHGDWYTAPWMVQASSYDVDTDDHTVEHSINLDDLPQLRGWDFV